jgi:ApbE superfamily uncharacterized protein (UPF0280 family)
MEYRERTYRNKVSTGHLASFHITVKETDLFISADRDFSELALTSVHTCRKYIEDYIRYRPQFLSSLAPIEADDHAPRIVRKMIEASQKSGVGPMAAVAGAVAQYVGEEILQYSENVIVENGGDIFLKIDGDEVRVGIFAGPSVLSHKISLRIQAGRTPLGICTSSGTVGHSLSLGKADAVCVTARSASLADAAATFIGNHITGGRDIRHGLDIGSAIEDILGIVIIVGDKLGAWGDIEFI